MLRFTIFAAVFPLSIFAGLHKEESSCPNGKKHHRVAIRHIESGGIGYKEGYTTLEAFLASDPSRWAITPFLDARGHVFNNGKWAANVGVGLRTLLGSRAYGINTYYDYRNAGRLNANQIGIGLETLGKLFDFRINGYLPIGAKRSAPYHNVFRSFSGNHLLVSQRIQSAMKGANAEFGFHFGKTKSFDFYAAAGPYYFAGKAAPSTWGGKARISGTFKEILTLEISDSYDRTFHNRFQGEVSLTFSFGHKSKVKARGRTCETANILNDRMLQPVSRQEIIVIDNPKKKSVAIDPDTGLPYFFVFVDNTSNSDGTYESPYHSLAQAQDNSAPNNIIYVFPGDGTTTGMDSGITLQANQKFWGSGVSHSIQTSQGMISIPAQSSSSPTITNTNIDTDGNAIVLATNNAISGFTIASAFNDAIFGTDPQSLQVSSCTFKNITTYPIEAAFAGIASVSLTDNQFLNNVNGVFLTLNGTSTVACANNKFEGQTSVSSVPLEVTANNNTLALQIENNLFNVNTTGSIRLNLNDVVNADINVLNNTITNNGTGSQASLASSCVIIANGTTANCSIVLTNNTFSNNTSNALYMHTSGAFTALDISAGANTVSNNGGSAAVLATPVDNLTLLASYNTITGCNDNGIAVIAAGATSAGNIEINNNTITDIGNSSNAIAITQAFSDLDLTVSDNEINGCQGTGILCFSNGFTNMTASITDNVISNCQNTGGGNAASGVSLDTYLNLNLALTNNTFSNDVSPSVGIGLFTSGNPTACLTMTGNSSNIDPSYSLTNPGTGPFDLSPCNTQALNTGTFTLSGTITDIQSCPDGAVCP